ncbi:benzoylacetate-CoA ligase [Halogeometricum pallidum JCM 14848]|uniref:Benzoylacetate-CoA ligase n=1 Tax=Halogeometricum pallidum JCM 14848 TaxID=1227487 RepID=M0D242_HALPD|nr:AMP-binding protein [Halogeometricum pallidum]ELZ28767.1 benzoylacetate-CoA ligase [Halogeometricum pallidum JCM 14848]
MSKTPNEAFAEIETEPWEEVQARQEELLSDQIDYLTENSSYYRAKFEEWDIDPHAIETVSDLRDVPFTEKDDERANQSETDRAQPLGAHQAAAREDLNRIMSSSGTTGEPTFFGLTESDLDAWIEMCARSVYAAGVRPDDVFVHAIGRTMVPGGLPYIQGIERTGATVVPAGDGDTERILKTTEKLDADGMFSTASYFQYLVDRAPEAVGKEVSEMALDTLIGGGEPGMADSKIRQQLYEAYGADRISEVMGIGDIAAALSGEGREEDGMHLVCQEYVLVELVDSHTGEAIEMEAGAEGELVYTPLMREATPLLRFRSGDYARITGVGECACGRTSPKIQVIGRADDMLIYKAQNVYPAGIREVLADVDGASSRMKVVLPEAGTVQFDRPIPVEVVRTEETDRSDTEIAEEFASLVRERLNVRIEPTVVPREGIDISVYKTDLVRVTDED